MTQDARDRGSAQAGVEWNADDVIRYHLALGAGAPSCEGAELGYVYEDRLAVLPTFAAVPASAASAFAVSSALSLAAPGVDQAALVHGEQSVQTFAPLPVAARSTNVAHVAGTRDTSAGRRIDVVVDTSVAGTTLARSTFVLLIPRRGAVPPARPAAPGPAVPPDSVVRVPTLPQQAALYRMSGDRTPLHIDPDVARAAGLPRPTLQGLCTWGIAAKCVVDTALGHDPAALAGFTARFAGPVYPGETLEFALWRRASGIDLAARVVERDAPALSRGRAEFRTGRRGP